MQLCDNYSARTLNQNHLYKFNLAWNPLKIFNINCWSHNSKSFIRHSFIMNIILLYRNNYSGEICQTQLLCMKS